MSDFITYLAVIATAQERGPVYAPPPPPLVKGGTFECRVFDEAERRIIISGELGNSRMVADGTQIAELKIARPDVNGSSFYLTIPIKPLKLDFSGYDVMTKTTVFGSLGVSSSGVGTITLELNVSLGARSLYAGFCNTQFSSTPRKITQ